jgi:hypothetical protein
MRLKSFSAPPVEAAGKSLNNLIVPQERRDEDRRIHEDALWIAVAVYESASPEGN